MVKCSFCKIDIAMGTGLIYVKKDGKVLNFCRKKCEKHVLKLKRKPRACAWTETAKEEKAKGKKSSAKKKQAKKSAKK